MGKRTKIKPGDVFGNLEVIENVGHRKYGQRNMTFWKCRCLRCGNIIDVPNNNLGTAQKDCGCGRHRPRKPISVGDQFGRLTVVEEGVLVPKRGYKYLCECSCDRHKRLYVRGDMLRSGEVRSCGCIHDELFKKNSNKGENSRMQGTCLKILNDKPQSNNVSGIRGVSWHKATRKWYARITYQKINYSLGYYDKIEDAAEARKIAENNLYKDFREWYAEQYPDKWRKMQEKL